MGEKPDQIERHIQHQRSELEDNISELEEKVKSAFDWRTQFEERPAIFLGAAFVGGAVVSALLPSTSRISSEVSSAVRRSSPASPGPLIPTARLRRLLNPIPVLLMQRGRIPVATRDRRLRRRGRT